jgi:hypothetical protein
MKVQDFAYNVAMRTMELLEHKQHYKITDEARKEISQDILSELHEIMKKS